MQGERWMRAGLVAVVLGAVVNGCGDSKHAEPPTAGRSSNAGASAGGVGGVGGSGGSGGSKSGSGGGGASSGGTAGSASPSGGAGQGNAGKGGGRAGTNGGAGAAGRGSAGMSGMESGSGAGGEGGEGGAGTSGDCPAGVVGTWALGDDNLYVVIESDCSISNFCSIAEVIHSRGSVTNGMVFTTVAGQPVGFAYVLSGDTLTLIDAGPNDEDLPLSQTDDPLPATCFEPP